MLSALLFSLSACSISASRPSADKPHIVFAMIDDWGWFNNGFHGNSLAQTPFLDKLVSTESLHLARHYVFKFCSPTRRSFLSGRVPPHSGQANSASVTIDLRMKTIADKLKSAGYTTAQAGKWHAGHATVAQTPKGRGFDTSLGYFNGACDHYTQVDAEDGCKKQGFGATVDLWDTDKPARGQNGTYGDYLYVGRAVDTIKEQDPSKPLFLYLAMQCAHDPMEAPQRFQDQFPKDTTPDVIEYAFSAVINEGIQNVTEALKAKGMWENTLLVVSSDNGGPAFSDQHAASNYPLRGGKYTYWEGGLRVNAFVTGGYLPEKLRGQNYTAPIHVCDWYSTFCGLAGVDPKDDAEGVPSIDSVDQWPLITGQVDVAAAEEEREIFAASGVLYRGKYKLVATDGGEAKFSGPLYPKVPADGPKSLDCSEEKPCLFDVTTDTRETNDISKSNPALLQNMTARLSVLMQGVFEGKQPNVTEKAVCEASEKNGGFLTPADWKE